MGQHWELLGRDANKFGSSFDKNKSVSKQTFTSGVSSILQQLRQKNKGAAISYKHNYKYPHYCTWWHQHTSIRMSTAKCVLQQCLCTYLQWAASYRYRSFQFPFGVIGRIYAAASWGHSNLSNLDIAEGSSRGQIALEANGFYSAGSKICTWYLNRSGSPFGKWARTCSVWWKYKSSAVSTWWPKSESSSQRATDQVWVPTPMKPLGQDYRPNQSYREWCNATNCTVSTFTQAL